MSKDYAKTIGLVCIRANVAHQAGAYPGFCSMKRPGWDASPSQGYPQHYIRRYPFIHLGGLTGEGRRESEVSCPKTQHNVPGHDATVPPTTTVTKTIVINYMAIMASRILERFSTEYRKAIGVAFTTLNV